MAKLRLGVFGSERWGVKMRERISSILGIDTFDIYGLTEIYGPGIGIDCPSHEGIHYWTDYVYFEIIDPDNGQVLPIGEEGELVITHPGQEGCRWSAIALMISPALSPGLQLRELLPDDRPHPGTEREAVKVKGVLVFPGQIDAVLKDTPGVSSEYQTILTREAGRDNIRIVVEGEINADPVAVAKPDVLTSRALSAFWLMWMSFPPGFSPVARKRLSESSISGSSDSSIPTLYCAQRAPGFEEAVH